MKTLTIALFSAATFLVPANAQEIRVDFHEGAGLDSGYFDKWDSVEDKLILYRDIRTPGSAAVRVTSSAGSNVSVFPLKDLPDAQRMTVWDAAATPDGGIVVSVIAEYGPREVKPVPVKLMLLTYDAAGNLAKVWDTAPYHHRLVAVDKEGNVFGFGSGEERSPLIVKYSPDGTVAGEFLPADTFALRDRVVQAGSQYGTSAMSIGAGTLALWLAPPQELLEFTLDGKLVQRLQLGGVINRLKDSLGMGGLEVSRASLTKDGELACEVILWPKDKAERAKFALMIVARDGSAAKLLTTPSEKRVPGFIGVTAEGKMMFREDVRATFNTYSAH
ncbi:MAG: hypothetical protein WBC78_09550 [Candidatus Sulfotelmatobacter sp.]